MLGERAPVDRRRLAVQVAEQLLHHRRRAADAVEVAGDVAPTRRQARDDGRRRREPVEVLEPQVDTRLVGDREQVQDAVRRAAGSGDADDRVLERRARDEAARTNVALDHVEHEPAGGLGCLRLRGIHRGDAAEPDRTEPEEVDGDRHRVGGEVPGARAEPGAGVALDRVQLLVGDDTAFVRADGLPDVLDRHLLAAVHTRRHRTGVEDEPGHVEAQHRHHRSRRRLVAADQADEAVERLAAADELDRVRDHLAADERGAHAGHPLRQVVGDGDRVELERCPAGRAHTGGDVLGQRALTEIARHRARPRRRDPDERAAQVVLVEAHRAEVRACPGAPRAPGEILVREPALHATILRASTEALRVESRDDRPTPEDRLRRPQLPRPRRRAGRRAAGPPAPVREVAEHPDRLRRPDPHPGDLQEPRLRGRARRRHRPPRERRRGRRRARLRPRLRRRERRLGPRPPVLRRPVGAREVARHVPARPASSCLRARCRTRSRCRFARS